MGYTNDLVYFERKGCIHVVMKQIWNYYILNVSLNTLKINANEVEQFFLDHVTVVGVKSYGSLVSIIIHVTVVEGTSFMR